MRIALVGCAAVAALAGSAMAQVRFRTVALSGQQAPGQPAGTRIAFFGTPPGATPFNVAPVTIDELGNTAFTVGLSAPGGGILGGAVVKNVNGVSQLVARHGDAAPGGGTFNINPLFNSAARIASGRCTFGALIGTTDFGVYTDRSGALARSLFSQDHPPGVPIPGSRFFNLAFTMARGGAIAYDAAYTDGVIAPREDEGLWRDANGTLEPVMFNGSPAPGAGPGVVFTEGSSAAFFGPVDVWSPNDDGRFIFNGYLGGPGVTTMNDEGVWAEDPSGLHLVVREGDPAPAAGAGARFLASGGLGTFGGIDVGLSGMALNTGGDAVFGAFLEEPGSNPPNVASLWARINGSLVLVAREGDAAPGFPAAFTYMSRFPRLLLSNSGRIAFSGSVLDPNLPRFISAIWTGQGAHPALLVREGDQRPQGGAFGPLSLFYQTDSGVTIFEDQSDTSFYSADLSGHITRLIAPGDRYEVGPGDARVVRQVGPGLGVTDSGDFGFTLEFTDLSQATVVASSATAACYANCDGSTAAPVLNVNDFICFQTRFAAGDSYANCDASTQPPVLNVNDFICFQARFAAGCP